MSWSGLAKQSARFKLKHGCHLLKDTVLFLGTIFGRCPSFRHYGNIWHYRVYGEHGPGEGTFIYM